MVYIFVGNLTGFSAVKELWKSVKIWQNYRHKRVAYFWDTVWNFLDASHIYV